VEKKKIVAHNHGVLGGGGSGQEPSMRAFHEGLRIGGVDLKGDISETGVEGIQKNREGEGNLLGDGPWEKRPSDEKKACREHHLG